MAWSVVRLWIGAQLLAAAMVALTDAHAAMPLHIACRSCGSQFTVPDRVAGHTVRCLKCMAAIAVSAAPSGRLAPLPVAEPLTEESRGAASAWLTVLLCTGMGVAFFLVVALLVVMLNKPPADTVGAVPRPEPFPPPENLESPRPAPPEVKPPEPKPSPPSPDRVARLAAIEAEEEGAVAALRQRVELHKTTLQKLSKAEDSLFPKSSAPLKPAPAAKLKARTDSFIRDQAAALRLIVTDLAALTRKREEFLQAKRKLLFETPQDGDPRLEPYGNLILTPDEIKDLVQREAGGNTPRAAALAHVQSAAVAELLKGTFYAGTFQHPDDPELAVIGYRTGTYRGRTEQPVHVYVIRLRGAWSVLELPGRSSFVLVGPPPNEYKRIEGSP